MREGLCSSGELVKSIKSLSIGRCSTVLAGEYEVDPMVALGLFFSL